MRVPNRVRGRDERELALMRVAGSIVGAALAEVQRIAAPGMTTGELDSAAETVIRDLGAVPSFKGYHGFPGTICASVNQEIVHGIPGERRLCEGDIVSVDVGTIYEGYQGDAAVTIAIGEITPKAQRLMTATRAALDAAIAQAVSGARLGDISHAVETTAGEYGFDVVREYGGHGIGTQMHEPPRIPNWGPAGKGLVLKTGMTLAIEPMLVADRFETRTLPDGWTVVTADGSLSAHYEHTVAVGVDRAEILTQFNGSLH